ncbi:MAG: hypothetical protein OXG74_13755 [Acidobacteria bacterium]|nr:hypothetical protein [Acidobacteriota bacterium]
MAAERRRLSFQVPAHWVPRIDELAGHRGRSEWLRSAVRRNLVEAGGLPSVPRNAPDPRQTVLADLEKRKEARKPGAL